MNEKLNYLEMLKNNVGEEMAEMMSDEITKVMDEQRGIEMEYARLVEQRDQLKGITNKHRLEETKDEIMVRTSTHFCLCIECKAVTLFALFKSYVLQWLFNSLEHCRWAQKQYQEALPIAAEEACCRV